MNLLLLLSALLSALTGVQAGAQAPQAAVAVSQPAQAVTRVRIVRGEVAGRPVTGLPVLVEIARAEFRRAWRLAASEPLFASRRRE